MAFNSASLGYVHAMAHQLGGFYDLPHGVCNAVLLPAVQEYNAKARSLFVCRASKRSLRVRAPEAPQLARAARHALSHPAPPHANGNTLPYPPRRVQAVPALFIDIAEALGVKPADPEDEAAAVKAVLATIRQLSTDVGIPKNLEALVSLLSFQPACLASFLSSCLSPFLPSLSPAGVTNRIQFLLPS
jgi:alcohol dehydrogenase class IV